MENQFESLMREVEKLINEYETNALKREKTIQKWEKRVEISKNEEKYLQEASQEFKHLTKLDKTDISFLALATGLQVLRWWLVDNAKFRFDSDQDTKKITNRIKKKIPQSAQLFAPVPYDAFRTGGIVSTGLSGSNHRVKALAHDPLAGWVVGPTNLLTESVTVNELPYLTYDVQMNLNGHYYIQPTKSVFPVYFAKGTQEAMADPKDLGFAVVRHGIHLSTDAFTKYGLPVPVLNTINPALSLKLQQAGQIDMYSVGRGILLSKMIDMIISYTHGFFYKEESNIRPELYNLKTEKIIRYSNMASSTANILTVGGMYASGNPTALKKLDVGGIIKTVTQIVTDPFFIQNMELDFVTNRYRELILD